MTSRSTERREFLSDIVIAAVEGGTGYWAQVSMYKHSDADPTRAMLHEVNDDENGYKAEGLLLDEDAVARGIGRILRDEVGLNSSSREMIAAASRENNACNIDADLADCIAQAALLGEIRYG